MPKCLRIYSQTRDRNTGTQAWEEDLRLEVLCKNLKQAPVSNVRRMQPEVDGEAPNVIKKDNIIIFCFVESLFIGCWA